MRNKYYKVNVPPWGKIYYIVNLPGGLLYDTGCKSKYHTVKAMSSPDLVTSDDKYINSYRQ